MGRLSSCANSKYETLISDKFYLRHVCTNSCSPGSGWRSQAFRSSRFSGGPVSAGRTRFLGPQVRRLGVARPDSPSRGPHPVAAVRFSAPRLPPPGPQRPPPLRSQVGFVRSCSPPGPSPSWVPLSSSPSILCTQLPSSEATL